MVLFEWENDAKSAFVGALANMPADSPIEVESAEVCEVVVMLTRFFGHGVMTDSAVRGRGATCQRIRLGRGVRGRLDGVAGCRTPQ